MYIVEWGGIMRLEGGNVERYEWNDCLRGDFLWRKRNIGEGIGDVMRPLRWWVVGNVDEEWGMIGGYYVWSG
ncbi:hypothetical protein, partial [Bacillus velezensis]|uniref:hypothetical protein n=1 Tax=Bacillus velezensis TaxID=492670 RepID=UPI001C92DAE2